MIRDCATTSTDLDSVSEDEICRHTRIGLKYLSVEASFLQFEHPVLRGGTGYVG